MIKLNELRYGNWIDCGDVNYYQWLHDFVPKKQFETLSRKYDSYTIDGIEPIPLTPEILEKAGLTKSDKVDVAYTISIFTDLPDGKIHRYHKEGLSEPKYLHQLQNLYWILTGTELEINLNP